MNKVIKNSALVIFFALVSFIIVMQSTQNPWSIRVPTGDSTWWLSVVVDMLEGSVLYVDVYDHKGPVVIWIFYIGLFLTPHSLLGIWLLEWLFWGMAFFLFYKTARLYTPMLTAVLAVLLIIEPVGKFFNAGTVVETWALPFIGLALYLFTKYLKTQVFNYIEVFMIGLCMAFTFMVNANLISLWIVFVPYLLILLIKKKDFEVLKKCILWFTIGMLVVFAGTAVWLLIFSSLSGFWYYNFTYNIGYSFNDFSLRNLYSLFMGFAYTSSYFIWLHLISLVIILKKKNYPDLIFFIFTVVALLMSCISGRLFMHYAIQLLPCLVIPAAICMETLRRIWGNNKGVILTAILFFMVWGRFDADKFAENIKWTIDESTPWREHATYGYTDYQNINKYFWNYSAEELRTKVTDIDENNPKDWVW